VIARYRESDLDPCFAYRMADAIALTWWFANIIILPVNNAIREGSAGSWTVRSEPGLEFGDKERQLVHVEWR
jgi:hypothetical protein